jgi:hypothetical protein
MLDAPLALEVCSVTKAFGRIVALDNVWLALQRGEIHALIGHKRRRQEHATSLRIDVQICFDDEFDAAAVPHHFDAVRRQVYVHEGPCRAQIANHPGRSGCRYRCHRSVANASERGTTNEW